MKKAFLFAAVCALMAGCSESGFVGDQEILCTDKIGEIAFQAGTPAVTRSTVTGSGAASKLSNHFVVYGTKHASAEDNTAANDALVFNQYNMEWTANSAGSSSTNTHNWEYVGKSAYASITGTQSAKYWDFDAANGYTFYAFSSKDISYPASSANDKVQVTKTTTGSTDKYDKGYSVTIKSGASFSDLYFADRIEVAKTDYGKPVSFTFRKFAAKVRVGFYETVPGYSVTIDRFYYDSDASAAVTDFTNMADKDETNFRSALQNVNTANSNTVTASYYNTGDFLNRARFYNSGVTYLYNLTLGTNLIGTKLGTTSSTAVYDKTGTDNYTYVFPFEANTNPMLIKCDYTLTAEDGQGETIKVKSARTVVPLQYVQWKNNYCYTYLFKITDNTNGTTGTVGTDKEGMYPITFDAVAITDDENSQTTHTTLNSNSITTYAKDGYKKSKDIYVVTSKSSDHSVIIPSAIGAAAGNAQIYKVESTAENISEATVYAKLTGAANGLTLTAFSDAFLEYQVPAADGTNYTFGSSSGKGAVKFTPNASSTAKLTYAYVYCSTAYVAPTYAKVGSADFSSTTTYYFKVSDKEVYYAASGLSADNFTSYKSSLYTQTDAGTAGTYDIKVINITD